MQQILNNEERNQAFLKFLLFFLITVSLIIAAVYFNFKVPSKENEWLKGQLEVQQIQEANQAKFVSKMEEAVELFEEMDNKDANVDLLFSKVNKIIVEMQELQSNERTMYGKMNKAIVGKFTELNKAKKDLAPYNDLTKEVAKLKTDLSESKQMLDGCQKDLDAYRRSAEQ